MSPEVDVMCTKQPEPCARNRGAAAREVLKLPLRCTPMTASQSSSVILWKMASRRIPALLTTMSIPPKRSTACSTIPCAGGKIHDAVEVRLCLAARIANRADRLERRDPILALAGGGAARIVHDHLRAVRSQHLRDLGADAASGAGDERDLSVNHPGHEALPLHSCAHLSNRSSKMPPNARAPWQPVPGWCPSRLARVRSPAHVLGRWSNPLAKSIVQQRMHPAAR